MLLEFHFTSEMTYFQVHQNTGWRNVVRTENVKHFLINVHQQIVHFLSYWKDAMQWFAYSFLVIFLVSLEYKHVHTLNC